MRLLHLYRPSLPGLRAQAIQVVHTSHALAQQGFKVTLLADRSGPGDVQAALALLGLTAHPNLDLRLCPIAHLPTAGVWFRASLTQWWMGPPGVVLARDKRRLLGATKLLPKRHRIVLETHELDSALATERGDNPESDLAIEAQALRMADALVANCGGTLRAWAQMHQAQMPATAMAVHNATAPDRHRSHTSKKDDVIRYVGSVRAVKGLLPLLQNAGDLPLPIEIIGATQEEQAEIPSNISVRPPVPYTEVPDLLATAAVLLLPLQDNFFGQQITSPLKLWDYLASSTPIVAADLPCVHEILQMSGSTAHMYAPNHPESLGPAIAEALAAPTRTPHLRTWADRAAELAPILRGSP